ncbi:MAG: TlpA disulfide reductase family protein [Methylocystis sp.]
MFEKCLRSATAIGALLALLSGAAFATEFKPYGRGSFEELRKQHAGRPIVVHFWSVTCPSCLGELPEWAKMAAERKALDIVFVNADPDKDRPRAQSRIDKAGLSGLVQYGFADDFVERLYFEADKSWRGELPFTALIGADGALVTVTGTIDDPLIADWLARAGK